jgi:Xaa-Pro aminopeptidase
MATRLETDLKARLAKVQEQMARRGFGGVIAYYGGQHNMLRTDPILLLADFRVLGPSALLIPARGEPTLIITPAWDLPRARRQSPLKSITAVALPELPDAIATSAKELPQPLALTGSEVMPTGFARALEAALGAVPADGADVIRATCATRTPCELERIEKAATIADAGFARLCEVARPGMREHELAAEIDAAMQELGSEDNFGLMSTGPHNVAVRAVTDRLLEPGDVIVSEITPCYRGYFAQLCRTFILGEPTEAQRRWYDVLLKAEAAGLDVARAGRPSAGIAQAINEVISAAGLGEYCRPPYMRTRGHGLGLGGVVPYDITESASPVLERDMTMVIHPNQYIPETGYMMMGDTVVIEDGAPRALTSTPRRLFWRAP